MLVTWPLMIVGVGGIGKRSWEWVTTLSLTPPALPLTSFSGELLLRSLLKALLMKEKHTSENRKFDATLSTELRQKWLMMIQSWESDKSKPNPYMHTEKGIFYCCIAIPRAYVPPASNLAEVRRKLAEADEVALRRDGITPPLQVPGSVFIRSGLEIEDQQ